MKTQGTYHKANGTAVFTTLFSIRKGKNQPDYIPYRGGCFQRIGLHSIMFENYDGDYIKISTGIKEEEISCK